MSRAGRLFELLQVLRRHRYPVTAAALAAELEVSVRTLYRDIASLQAQGATIEGEAGIGYVLRPGFTLPPLMFTTDELETLALGSRWVTMQGDAELSLAARNALAKIRSVLPRALLEDLDASAMLVGPPKVNPAVACDLTAVRRAIRTERKIVIAYQDQEGRPTRRTIWPFALAFFSEVRLVAAWCETRQGFRHFRADRITEMVITSERYPRKRQALLREWRVREIESPGS
jgi:predicted DNA-binding transcriptional regulator YafY